MRHGPALLLFVGVGAPSTAAWAAGHCTPSETVVFDCSVGRKQVSVCAVDGASGARYRFGVPGRPELVLPAPAAPSATRLSAGTLMFSGGGGAYLRFRRAAHDYVVYTAVGRGWGEKAGVVVEQAGKRLAALRCRGDVRSQLGPDWFSRAGVPEDTEGLDLP